MNRKAKAFSCSEFPNKDFLVFSTEVLIISDLSVIEILIVIKTSSEKHQNIIKFSINFALDVDIDYAFR